MKEQAALLGRLTRVVASVAPGAPLMHRLCVALTEILELDGATMTVGYSAPTRTTLCATDEVAEWIEDIQDVVREGPGLDAHRLGRPVRASGAELSTRWPLFAESLAEGPGLRHLVAVPMRPDTEVLGVLTLYGEEQHTYDVDLESAQFLANAIGVAVVGGFDRGDRSADLWSARDTVDQATGMVVAQLRISPADALALLRAHAFAHEAALIDIAREVVGRALDFRPGTDPDDPETTEDHHDDH